MIRSLTKFLAKVRFTVFVWRMDYTIDDRVLAQLRYEKKCGYPFNTIEQMNDQTRARDLRVFLDLIDEQTREMPKAYGDAFRYLMHRDLYDRIQRYVKLVQRRIPHRFRIAPLAA